MKKKSNSFYIYGRQPVKEVLIRSPQLVDDVFVVGNKPTASLFQLVTLAQQAKKYPKNIDKKQAEKMVGEVNTQGIVARLSGFPYTDFKEWKKNLPAEASGLVMILTGIQDVQNFGAIIRTATAVGVEAIIVPKSGQAPVSGAVFKTSVGTVLGMKIISVSNINQSILDLQKQGFWLYAIDMERADAEEKKYPNGNIFEQDFSVRTAFVLGSEGKGIPQKTRELCDFVTPIPMENKVESLNVSVAAAVCMYEWRRQRKNNHS